MDSQSQDFHVLARVKRKRKKGDQASSGIGRYGSTVLGSGKSLGSFIQSTRSGGEEEGSMLVQRRMGGYGTSKLGGGRSAKKGSSHARKKLKLGAREQVKLGAVKWPGFEGGEEDEDSAEIQVYSDSDLDQQEAVEDVSGFSDGTQEFFEQAGQSAAAAKMVKEEALQQLQQPIRRRRRRQCRGLRKEWQASTSTPCEQHEQVLTENIDEFESDTDASPTFSQSHSRSPPPSLRTVTPIVTPKTPVRCKPPISRGLPPSLQSFIGTLDSTSEDVNIGTPPSSPEASVSDLSKTKASDWIKQIALESLERCDMSNLHDTMTRTPYHGDSVKRGRGKKLVPGGLAEQLQRVIQREASEITFWEHKAKKLEEREIDPSSCLTVHVLSLTNCYSLFVARCHVLSGSPVPQAHMCAVAVGKERMFDTTRPSVEDVPLTSDQTQQPSTAEQYFQSEEQDGAQYDWTTSGQLFACGSTYQPSLNEMGHPSESGGSLRNTETHAGDPEPYSGALTLEEVALRGLHSSLSSTAETEHAGGRGDWVKHDSATVLFSQRCAKFLNLQVGIHVRIHPPWQCLSLNPHLDTVILCTHFCQAVGHTIPPQSPSSPVPCKQKGISGVFNLLSPEKTCLSNHSRLVKSPAKGLQPTRLFSDEAQIGRHPTVHSYEPCETTGRDSAMPGPTHVGSDSIRDVSSRSLVLGMHDRTLEGVIPCSLIEALESACCGMVNFTGRVERVYRRKMAVGRECGEQGIRYASMYQSFMQSARKGGPSCAYRWVLLVCDSYGIYAELQVTALVENHSPWCELIKGGEGKSFHFMNVRVIRRTTPSKNPELFSLISSLNLQPPKSLANQESPHSSNMNDWDLHPCSVLPLFCYVLECQSDSQTLPCSDITKCPPPSPTSPLATGSLHSGEGTPLTSPSRVNLLARVVHIQLEVPQEMAENGWLPLSPPGPRCGYYLFVVTMAPGGGQETVRVYLKSGFSVAGLRKVLTSPGTKLLLRDICYETHNTVERHYSMDTCSLVIPVYSASLGMDLTVYPERIFCSDELHTLSSLTAPHLPPLHPSTAAVKSLVQVKGCVRGVDEENAYSWPACDVCGSGKLSSVDDGSGSTNELYCDDCQRSVSSPAVHMQLAVFLHCPSLENHTVCVQLLQSTICELLPVAVSSVQDGFDVHHVLDRELSLQACYIREAKEIAGRVAFLLEEVDTEFPE